MPFATSGDDGTPLRAFANQSEPNPSPRVRRSPTITKERRRGPAPAEPQVSGRCTPSPTKGRVNGAPARNCIFRHGVASGLAGTCEGMARRERFEPEPSGRRQGRRDNYGVGPETTDSLGVVRGSPSLPISGYPSSTE